MLYSRVLLASAFGLAQASYDPIAGYIPGSSVTDHNAIDLDQLAFENLLDHGNTYWSHAYDVYNSGGNSRSQVTLTLGAAATIASGTNVYQVAADGTTVIAVSTRTNTATSTSVGPIRYPIGVSQATYVGCRTGTISAAPANVISTRGAPLTTGCMHSASQICVAPTAAPTTVAAVNACVGGNLMTVASVAHSAGRTIRGFTSNGARSWDGCPGCPYKDFMMFNTYFGDLAYAHTFVMAAIGDSPYTTGNQVTWGTGSPAAANFPVDLRQASDDARVEVATKGTVYLNIVMYAIREFEDAIDDCDLGNIGLNDEPVHAWDEGVAFYTGSLEGVSGTRGRTPPISPSGVLFYNLADYRCQNFRTCSGATGITGPSNVNLNLHRLFSQGQSLLQMGQCSEVRPVTDNLINYIRVPLIQGVLRYTYRINRLMVNQAPNQVWYAEGGVFAAAVLPVVHFCSAAAAVTIATNINLGPAIIVQGGASTDFAAIKTAFESVYDCMNITCTDVGGFWDTGNNAYYAGAEPCTRLPPSTPPSPPPPAPAEEKMPTWAIAILAVLGALFLIFFLGFCVMMQKEKAGKPIFVTKVSAHS